jgi:hypothetical protein
MWLPKDERKLLAHYYQQLHESGVDARGDFFLSTLESCLKGVDARSRAITASNVLQKRNLIVFLHHRGDAITVQLGLEGYELGRKYSSKLHTFLLLCNEYKVWIILGLIISFVGVLIVILKD